VIGEAVAARRWGECDRFCQGAARARKGIEKVEDEIAALRAKLGTPGFVATEPDSGESRRRRRKSAEAEAVAGACASFERLSA